MVPKINGRAPNSSSIGFQVVFRIKDNPFFEIEGHADLKRMNMIKRRSPITRSAVILSR
jgi:hypothetical protein